MSMSFTNSSIWSSGIAALAPEDVLRLVRISEPYVNTTVVQKPLHNGTPVYALGVSNLHELGKALSSNVPVIHIHHDCTSLIQEQRRRQRDLKMRRNMEWITITTAFSGLFATYWMRNQRFMGHGESQSAIKSLFNDFQEHVHSLLATFTIANHSISQTNGDSHQGVQPRLSPAEIIATGDIAGTSSQNSPTKRSGFFLGCPISYVKNNKGTILLTSTIIASMSLWIRSRHDYVLIKVNSTDSPRQIEHFLIRQDAAQLNQSLAEKARDALPLCIAVVASSVLIQRTWMSSNR
ncbi:hypothetical protein K450DRAFT_235607 [Umbelopsis ramanniana AG]|uniref:Uncharacterized protein n=1 Tax=Umbelopsis ramanniana AG TaxID=1314678 RepID=A0AAD5ECL0_UMBRA|nr:uncharacterized protein K450DRAFT_235607 [Umbelopsis ramanniana AG]KAI8580714.1 hypothetical protein K450DRAFT_235607 [Umbelopsis ramanniana AG]